MEEKDICSTPIYFQCELINCMWANVRRHWVKQHVDIIMTRKKLPGLNMTRIHNYIIRYDMLMAVHTATVCDWLKHSHAAKWSTNLLYVYGKGISTHIETMARNTTIVAMWPNVCRLHLIKLTVIVHEMAWDKRNSANLLWIRYTCGAELENDGENRWNNPNNLLCRAQICRTHWLRVLKVAAKTIDMISCHRTSVDCEANGARMSDTAKKRRTPFG